MRLSPEDRRFVEASLGGRLVASRRLPGGISAQTRRVRVARPSGEVVSAVFRRVSDEWMAAEPGLVGREAAVLSELERHGVPAPRLVAYAPEGPLLMTFEPGRPVHRPPDVGRHVLGLVEAVLKVHAVGPPTVSGLRQQLARLRADVREPAPWRHGFVVDADHWALVAAAWPSVSASALVSVGADVLIHDDFHPGNVLWRRGRVTAIVDWTGASVGQPASDITYLALDVSLILGLDVGDLVYEAYSALTGSPVPDRPFWELVSASRAVGVVDLWHGSWVDFGIRDLPLALVEERLAAFVERAAACTG